MPPDTWPLVSAVVQRHRLVERSRRLSYKHANKASWSARAVAARSLKPRTRQEAHGAHPARLPAGAGAARANACSSSRMPADW